MLAYGKRSFWAAVHHMTMSLHSLSTTKTGFRAWSSSWQLGWLPHWEVGAVQRVSCSSSSNSSCLFCYSEKKLFTAATLAAPRCQTCLILSRQPHRVCEQLRRLKTGSVNSSHYQIIFAQQHVLNGHRTSTNNKLNLSIKVFNIIWLLSRIHMF